jgi:hypothetical protein
MSGNMPTNDARRTREIKFSTVMKKSTINKKKKACFYNQPGLKCEAETSRVPLHMEHSCVCGDETWTLRAVDQKYLESFAMWCWRRMEKIGWTDRVRNGEMLRSVKEGRNVDIQ